MTIEYAIGIYSNQDIHFNKNGRLIITNRMWRTSAGMCSSRSCSAVWAMIS